jgi:hypothetical protein
MTAREIIEYESSKNFIFFIRTIPSYHPENHQ